jgi:carboxylesterase
MSASLNLPQRKPRSAFWPLWARLAASLAVLLALAAGYLYWPENPAPLRVPPQPAADYAEAELRLQAFEARLAGLEMHPLCGTHFLTHGQRQPRAIVLVHGYTDCPAQFATLGEQFYALGYNVLIAPLPRHGLLDRLNDEQAQLTAEALAAYAGEALDIARGLGEHVTMLGLSGGALVTAWAAQERSDLDLAVVAAPAFGYQQVPDLLTRPAARLYQLLPNSYRWKNSLEQANALPEHSYPRYATRALAQVLRLGDAVQVAASREAPAAARIVVVTNANDDRVSNSLTAQVVAQWRRLGGSVDTYEFPASLALAHDLIEPDPPNPNTPVVYATLIDLVEP